MKAEKEGGISENNRERAPLRGAPIHKTQRGWPQFRGGGAAIAVAVTPEGAAPVAAETEDNFWRGEQPSRMNPLSDGSVNANRSR